MGKFGIKLENLVENWRVALWVHIPDLHTHSTASDGQYTPTQLVSMAKERGLEALALTDHDTIDGLKEAVQAGKQCGLRVIPGIELSAKEYPTFHILGYGFNVDALSLAELCHKMKTRRNERARRLLAYLKEKTLCSLWRKWGYCPAAPSLAAPILPRRWFARDMCPHCNSQPWCGLP